MREIAFAIENQYMYYYMGTSQLWDWSLVWCASNNQNIGYYIHSCQKMRYKANFRPQYILGRFHSCLSLSTFRLYYMKSCARHLTVLSVTQTPNPATGTRLMAK
jgi:hypothetical protein